MRNNLTIKVKYFNKDMVPLEINPKGDLVDLRVRSVEMTPFEEDKNHIELSDMRQCEYKKDDVLMLHLGIAVEMPKGYKMNIYPRSSTFKNYGFILTNSTGQIDNSFNGDEDEILAMVWCTRDGMLEFNDRVLQMEIVPSMYKDHSILFKTVDKLEDGSRGGYGTTGVK